MKMHCVGCGNFAGEWELGRIYALTCACGATMFAEEDNTLAPPASFVIGLNEDRDLAHIDYYLGLSNHNSSEKDAVYRTLRSRGSIWSWQCEECVKNFLDRIKFQKESMHMWQEYSSGMPFYELHPEIIKRIE